MNILITINENFLFPAKVMLYSLAKYHRDLRIFMIYSEFSDEQLAELKEFVKQKCHAEFVPVMVENIFKDAPLSEQYGKPELYYRLMTPYVLPAELDRVLYMDADIIIKGDLSLFYEQDLEGAYAAFVKDRYDFCEEVVAQKKKLGLSDEDTYFNSGVILFDLKAFRENIKLEDILEFIKENRDALRFFDQDTFNVLLRKHKKLCEERYNFQVYPFEDLNIQDVKDMVVVHFTDLPKPWDEKYNGHLDELFWSNVTEAGL